MRRRWVRGSVEQSGGGLPDVYRRRAVVGMGGDASPVGAWKCMSGAGAGIGVCTGGGWLWARDTPPKATRRWAAAEAFLVEPLISAANQQILRQLSQRVLELILEFLER